MNSAGALSRRLKAAGIARALVSSTDAILYPDPAACNADLLKAVKGHPMLIPVPVVNPALTNWRAIVSAKNVKAVKIIPNYHNYPLVGPVLAQLMEVLAERKIPLMIQMRAEDERNQYPLMKIPGVDFKAVVQLANDFPAVSIICLCAYFGEAVELAQKTGKVSVDISFIETFQTLPSLLKQIPPQKILFGSHTPFLYTEAAMMKLKTTAPAARRTIACANARRLFDI
ncbi:MAG: amidohydrolase family protein [Kiritimatiellae bacterium]|nr:amidohydrolase family protein [Kiritimatiellia bacterium]